MSNFAQNLLEDLLIVIGIAVTAKILKFFIYYSFHRKFKKNKLQPNKIYYFIYKSGIEEKAVFLKLEENFNQIGYLVKIDETEKWIPSNHLKIVIEEKFYKTKNGN
jgi:hypothetical protein